MNDILYYTLPALLVFAITYGALEVGGIIKNRSVNGVIALVFAFFSISSPVVISMVYSLLPYAAIFFIVVFLIGFLVSPFRGEKKEPNYELAAIVCTLALVWLVHQPQIIQNFFPGITGTDIITLLGLVIIAVIFFMVYKTWSKQSPGPGIDH
ncbi:MAG: DUF2304 family protein [Candidatus Aenigmatarchaeota archaeon]